MSSSDDSDSSSDFEDINSIPEDENVCKDKISIYLIFSSLDFEYTCCS
jgi:hypothetical protein